MWKDFVAINGSECVRALTCIAIDDPLGGGRREELSALTPTPHRLYIGSGSNLGDNLTPVPVTQYPIPAITQVSRCNWM